MPEAAALLSAFQSYGYAALFLIFTFGGPPAALGAGLLASQGFFSPWLIWPLAILADLTADIAWYSLGRFGREKVYLFIQKLFSVAESGVAKAEHLFTHHGAKIIFFSKTTMGLGFLGQFMLTLQGFLRIPFRIFILYNFLGGVILSGAATFAGYYFGLAWSGFGREIRSIIFVAFLAAVILVWKILRRLALLFWSGAEKEADENARENTSLP